MVNVVCDSCKKMIRNAEKDINVFYYADKGLCYDCKEEMEGKVHEQLTKQGSYSLREYKNTLLQTLDKMSR